MSYEVLRTRHHSHCGGAWHRLVPGPRHHGPARGARHRLTPGARHDSPALCPSNPCRHHDLGTVTCTNTPHARTATLDCSSNKLESHALNGEGACQARIRLEWAHLEPSSHELDPPQVSCSSRPTQILSCARFLQFHHHRIRPTLQQFYSRLWIIVGDGTRIACTRFPGFGVL